MAPRVGSSVEAQTVLPLRQCLKWYLQNPYLPPLPDGFRELLKRWLDDPDAENVWNTIRAHSEQRSGSIGIDAPVAFIGRVLEWMAAAERESEINQKVAANRPKIKQSEKEFRGELVRAVKEVPLDRMPQFLEETGKRLRERLREYPSPVIRPPRVRSDHGSRARTYFIRELSAFVHDTTGRWLDEEVAMITAILFDTDVSADAVRNTRK